MRITPKKREIVFQTGQISAARPISVTQRDGVVAKVVVEKELALVAVEAQDPSSLALIEVEPEVAVEALAESAVVARLLRVDLPWAVADLATKVARNLVRDLSSIPRADSQIQEQIRVLIRTHLVRSRVLRAGRILTALQSMALDLMFLRIEASRMMRSPPLAISEATRIHRALTFYRTRNEVLMTCRRLRLSMIRSSLSKLCQQRSLSNSRRSKNLNLN